MLEKICLIFRVGMKIPLVQTNGFGGVLVLTRLNQVASLVLCPLKEKTEKNKKINLCFGFLV
jgi:hypothetical protein